MLWVCVCEWGTKKRINEASIRHLLFGCRFAHASFIESINVWWTLWAKKGKALWPQHLMTSQIISLSTITQSDWLFFSHYRTQHLQQSLVDDNDKCTFSRDRKNWWLFSLLFFLLCLDAVACDLIVWAKRFITESCFFLNVLFRYNSVTLSLTASETKVSCHDFIKNAIDYRVFFLSFRLNIKVKSIDTYTKRA